MFKSSLRRTKPLRGRGYEQDRHPHGRNKRTF